MNLPDGSLGLEEEAARIFVRQHHGEWTPADQAALEQRLLSDLAFAEHYRLAELSADTLRTAANSPQMIRFREQALASARRSGVRGSPGPDAARTTRWRWALGAAAGFLTMAIAWQISPWGYRQGQYHTGIGEQRIIEMEDHSRVILDAQTRLVIQYTNESRTVRLIEGRAQFSVAQDPSRPFRVRAGDQTVVALGTVFTVELADHQFHVALVDGRVAVVPLGNESQPAPVARGWNSRPSASEPALGTVELSAGEELNVDRDGRAVVTPQADIEAATAWRNGKVVFRTERLADAVWRMNRYSRVQLQLDDEALANETVSGVFEAGDTQGFIAGVQLALPVTAHYRDSSTVQLSLKRDGAPVEDPKRSAQ